MVGLCKPEPNACGDFVRPIIEAEVVEARILSFEEYGYSPAFSVAVSLLDAVYDLLEECDLIF